MIRALYQLVLLLHPPAFRKRFGDEMMSIFEENRSSSLQSALLFDGFSSFLRQWLLRSGSWRLPVALGAAFLQVFGFAFPRHGHQSWTRNYQALSPEMQEIFFLILASLGGVTILVVALVLWTSRFQRVRARGCPHA